MNNLLESLAWCGLQVTLVALLAWLLCGIARRLSASHAAALPATALAAVLVLTGLAFIPWPAGWSYGPVAGWEQVPRPENAPPAMAAPALPVEPETTAISPALAVEANLHLEEAPIEPTPTPASSVAEPTPVASSPPLAVPAPSAPLGPRPWPWPTIALSLLALGAAAGLVQLLAGLAAVQSYRRRSMPLEDKALRELADVICAQLCCRSQIELRETPALATAATIGWRKPLVLLPREWRDWSPEQLRAVLAHEIAHIVRHDFLACVLAQTSLALHFYHPLVHWLVRRLRLEQELAADAAAAVATGGRVPYLQALAELALRQSERPLGWPARTFLPTRGTFMRRIEMLRDAKNGPAEESRWRAWPRRLAVLLLIAGAVAIAGLRGAAPPGETAQAQDKPKAAGDAKKTVPDSGEVSLAQFPNDSLAVAAIRLQPLLKNPETAEVLSKLDRRSAASKAAVPLEKIAQISFVLTSGERIQHSEPMIVVETSQEVDFNQIFAIDGLPMAKVDEIKVADLKEGRDLPPFGFLKLGDRAAVLGSPRMIAGFIAARRGNPSFALGDGWKLVSSRPLVVGIDMMALRRLAPSGDSPAEWLKRLGLGPVWDETESLAAGVTLGKKADFLVVADCLGEKGMAQLKETTDAGAVIVRNMLREVRAARLKQVADNLGSRTIAEPEFAQFLFDAADKALSNVKVKQAGETLVTAQASVDLKGRLETLANLVPSVEAIQAESRKSQSANNLKQIMLAMHNYADTYGGQFPPAIIYGKDGKGKFPHSWRVALLPYLDQDALYRQYQFDEPWDSEANRKVLAQMPKVFQAPGADPKSTTSSYYVLIGKAAEAKRGEEGGAAGAAAPPGGAGAAPPMGGAIGPPGGAPAAGGAAVEEDSVEKRFDGTVVKYVDEVLLGPNDKDGDGQLNGDEFRAMKWSKENPPENSDLDKDGNLNRAELCQRISKSRGILFKDVAGAVIGFVVDTSLPTVFSKGGGKEGMRFAEIADGTSNTLAVVEAKRDIPWTKPEDIAYDPKGKAPQLGGIYDDGFWVGVCDGSVRFLPTNVDADFLRAFLSPAGGEILPDDPPTGAGAGDARPVPVPTNRGAPPRPRGR